MTQRHVFALLISLALLAACGQPAGSPNSGTGSGTGGTGSGTATGGTPVGTATVTGSTGNNQAITPGADGVTGGTAVGGTGTSGSNTTGTATGGTGPGVNTTATTGTGGTGGTGGTNPTATMTNSTVVTGTATTGTIAAVITQDARFSMLAAALQSANIATDFEGPGPYTLFAPTNEAFQALPAGTLDALLANQTELAALLRYHVAQGNVEINDLRDMTSIPTLAGRPIQISSDGTDILLNTTIRITLADIEATNGVIHIIDAVLQPPTT